MPKEMHKSLEMSASKKGLTGLRKNAYVYGPLQKYKKKKKRKKASGY